MQEPPPESAGGKDEGGAVVDARFGTSTSCCRLRSWVAGVEVGGGSDDVSDVEKEEYRLETSERS